MARVNDNYKIFEIIYESVEPQPYVKQEIKIDEWDETGTTITHNINIIEILDIQPYKSNDKWMLKYIIKSR